MDVTKQEKKELLRWSRIKAEALKKLAEQQAKRRTRFNQYTYIPPVTELKMLERERENKYRSS